MLLIIKTDLIDATRLAELQAVLRTLNPGAELIPMDKGRVPLDKVHDTGRFSFERAQQAAGWLKELRGEHVPETEEYGISSFAHHGFAGLFWKAVPESRWPDDPAYRAAIREKWQELFGDMRQELVFISQHFDRGSAGRSTTAC